MKGNVEINRKIAETTNRRKKCNKICEKLITAYCSALRKTESILRAKTESIQMLINSYVFYNKFSFDDQASTLIETLLPTELV